MQILIAEDDFTSRAMLTAVLRKWGYDPVPAENGTKTWAALQQPDAPKLVLLDWNMPEMDGLEVTRRVRALTTPTPPYIILLTAKDEEIDIIHGLEAGANDYISKPYGQGELKARLDVGRRMVELQAALAGKIAELQKTLDEVRTLRGIIPICAKCKKIRDDKGYWNQVEVYVRAHSDAEFSHGFCPECARKLYPGFAPDGPSVQEKSD